MWNRIHVTGHYLSNSGRWTNSGRITTIKRFVRNFSVFVKVYYQQCGSGRKIINDLSWIRWTTQWYRNDICGFGWYLLANAGRTMPGLAESLQLADKGVWLSIVLSFIIGSCAVACRREGLNTWANQSTRPNAFCCDHSSHYVAKCKRSADFNGWIPKNGTWAVQLSSTTAAACLWAYIRVLYYYRGTQNTRWCYDLQLPSWLEEGPTLSPVFTLLWEKDKVKYWIMCPLNCFLLRPRRRSLPTKEFGLCGAELLRWRRIVYFWSARKGWGAAGQFRGASQTFQWWPYGVIKGSPPVILSTRKSSLWHALTPSIPRSPGDN